MTNLKTVLNYKCRSLGNIVEQRKLLLVISVCLFFMGEGWVGGSYLHTWTQGVPGGGTMHRGLSMGFTVAIVNIKWISGKGIIGEY